MGPRRVLAVLLFWLPRAQAADAPGAFARYSSADSVSDDVQADHVWLTLPNPNEKVGNAVFAHMQFEFENGVGGTFGTHVWREGAIDTMGRTVRANETHRAVFSIPDGPAAEAGRVGWRGTNCGRYGGDVGGDGSGSHCVLPIQLVVGDAFNLRVFYNGSNGTGDWWAATVVDVKARSPPARIGELYLPNTSPKRRGAGKLVTKATASHEYFEATGCDRQPLSRVGLVGPWWQGAALSPTQAYADYAPGCPHSDVGNCIYGVGCGPLRVLLTAGGETTRMHTNTSAPLWSP